MVHNKKMQTKATLMSQATPASPPLSDQRTISSLLCHFSEQNGRAAIQAIVKSGLASEARALPCDVVQELRRRAPRKQNNPKEIVKAKEAGRLEALTNMTWGEVRHIPIRMCSLCKYLVNRGSSVQRHADEHRIPEGVPYKVVLIKDLAADMEELQQLARTNRNRLSAFKANGQASKADLPAAPDYCILPKGKRIGRVAVAGVSMPQPRRMTPNVYGSASSSSPSLTMGASSPESYGPMTPGAVFCSPSPAPLPQLALPLPLVPECQLQGWDGSTIDPTLLSTNGPWIDDVPQVPVEPQADFNKQTWPELVFEEDNNPFANSAFEQYYGMDFFQNPAFDPVNFDPAPSMQLPSSDLPYPFWPQLSNDFNSGLFV